MPRKRTAKNSLLILIEESPAPVYLMDAEFKIIFANEALANWIGLARESCPGLACSRRGTPLSDPTLNALRGLGPSHAPPSETFQDTVFAIHSNGTIEQRTACFQFLPAEIEDEDSPDGELAPSRSARAHHWLVSVAAAPLTVASDERAPDHAAPFEADDLAIQLAAILADQSPATAPLATIGNSAFARRLKRQLAIAAQGMAQTVIVGPAGSERESVARYLFQSFATSKAEGLIPVDCAIADQTLIQETIKRIARQGQDSQQTLPFWLLLIDAHLLPVEGQIELEGFLRLPKNRLRTLATSAVSLTDHQRLPHFSRDLAHRITEWEITLPPLSQRFSDLPLIAQFLLENRSPDAEGEIPRLSEAALEWLLEYDWPGNLREFQQTMEEMLAAFQEDHQSARTKGNNAELLPHHLPKRLQLAIKHGRLEREAAAPIDLTERLEFIEREFIERALQAAKHNKTKAAQLLNLSRGKFLRRCEHLEIAFPDPPIDFRPDEEPIEFLEDDT